MEAIQQARKLFIKCHHYEASLTEADKHQLERDIQRFITIAIKEATAKDLFQNVHVLYALKSALKQRALENSDLLPLARAFRSLEKYFLHLVEQPWKPEFREIKMYGGFYRTRIKSVIPDCEVIFECGGYMIFPESCSMVYRGPVHKTSLLLLAFDCRVGQVECETIAAHHSKLKGLSMSLTDAISNILHDENSREPLANSYEANHGNGYLMPTATELNRVTPPAIPKREPIINGSDIRQNGKYDVTRMFDDHVAEKRFLSGISFPPAQLVPVPDLYSVSVLKPPLTPSSVTPEPIVYMDVSAEEILPELPQGTCEDHMRESLKLVDQQTTLKHPVEEDWKWLMESKNRKSISSSEHLAFSTPAPYSVNGLNLGTPSGPANVKSAFSFDEGIEIDMSKSYLNSSRFSSTGGQQMIANKQPGTYPHPSFDQGYRTAVNTDSICSPLSSVSISQNSQPTIYHPPSVVTESAGPATQNKTLVSRQNAVPPPIPSRALKPKLQVEEYPQSRLHMSAPHYFISQPAANTAHFQNEIMLSRPHMSAPGHTSQASQMPALDPVMRRERQAVAKTNSLKSGTADHTLTQQMAMSRMAKSMDMTAMLWECQYCTSLNKASNTICFTCTHSRLGPDVPQLVCGETKKPCSSCTYENSVDNTHCDMCSSKLNDKYTFV